MSLTHLSSDRDSLADKHVGIAVTRRRSVLGVPLPCAQQGQEVEELLTGSHPDVSHSGLSARVSLTPNPWRVIQLQTDW